MGGKRWERPEWLSTNLIALAILLAAYGYSVVRWVKVSAETRTRAATEEVSGMRIVRVTHWQLEPGFREALQWAMEEYNRLPHVREAGVEVRQLPITERVFNQFLNVHLIAGTAPDVAARGMSRLIQGAATARFFTPLGGYVGEPNPYNARERLSPELPEELKEYLEGAPWSDTFLDGMEGGFEPLLQDYFAVPVSVWGGLRLFYNMDLLERVKGWAAGEVARRPQPEWVQGCWLREGAGGGVEGFLRPGEGFEAWLKEPGSKPRTLGELLFYCRAVEAYAGAKGLGYLVPISGSNYTPSDLADYYRREFLKYARERLDWDRNNSLTELETVAGWQAGKWGFEDAPVREFFGFARVVTGFYPRGYLGLDREQAQRRFVMGKAAMISSGAWDAGAIFTAVKSRRGGGFRIAIARPPFPGEGERWAEFLGRPSSEANFSAGVPFAINRASPHFEWALDFLRFVSSQPVNEEMNRRAGWLPAVVGAKPSALMAPFAPVLEGSDWRGALAFGTGFLHNTFTGQAKVLMSGGMSYEEFVERMTGALRNPRHGVEAVWRNALVRAQDRTLADEGMMSVLRVRGKVLGEGDAGRRFAAWVAERFPFEDGRQVRWMWRALHGEQPFPGTGGQR